MAKKREGGKGRGGFSLITVSILLTVAAVVMVSFLPGREAGDVNVKTTSDVRKLEKVEEAMRAFMVANGRRPCPADGQYPLGNQYFGIEAATPGTCTGGTPAAPLGPDAGSSHVVGGTIPTNTLHLSDDYAFDEYGRRYTYVVDTRATLNSSCLTLQNYPTNNGTGGILIKSTAGGSTIDNGIMYAYLSHGADGFGAWPGPGSASTLSSAQSVASRINNGSPDGDQQLNAGVDGSFNYSTSNFKDTFVQKAKTISPTLFDDIVWYRPDLKNTCCLGSAKCNSGPGFRLDGVTASQGFGLRVAHGHIHSTTAEDLVIVDNSGNNGGAIYVIFGGASLSGTHYTADNNATTGLIDGTHGFKIYNSGDAQLGAPLAVGDVNNDGYDDIVFCSNSSNNCYVFYGGSGLKGGAAAYNLNTYNGTCQTAVFQDDNGGGARYSALAIGDVNGDGYNDLLFGDWNECGTIPTGTITFTANPANTNTIKLGTSSGQTWTFETTCTGGNAPNSNCVNNHQTAIQASLSATVGQLVSDLTSSASAKLTGATYSYNSADPNCTGNTSCVVTVTYKTGSWNGTQFVLNKGTAANAVSGADLSCVVGGAVYIAFGTANTCPGTDPIARFPNNSIAQLTSATTPKGSFLGAGVNTYALSRFGVTVGDFNGDGITDIAIMDGEQDLYLVFGMAGTWNSAYTLKSSATVFPTNLTTPAGAIITNFNSGYAWVGASGNVLGHAGSMVDLLVGNGYGNNNPDNYLIQGASSWTSTPYTIGTNLSPLDLKGVQGDAALGNSIAIGDVNKDGNADIVFSSQDTGNGSAHGSAYLVFGSAGLLAQRVTSTAWNGSNGVQFNCSYANSNSCGAGNGFGNGVNAFDFNGDGTGDVVIAVPGGNAGDYSGHSGSGGEGYVYVIYGKSSGWTSPYALSTIY